MMEATTTYPALMAYIADRSAVEKWLAKLREDQAAARNGAFEDVTAEIERVRADYGAQARAAGHSDYPYNRDMGEFLGLPIRANGEPPHGYYMASQVARSHLAGKAARDIERLISEGRTLSIVTARAKHDRKPVRFARFAGDQIKIEGNTILVDNGKRRARLSSNWSEESCLQAVARALESGKAYGEGA